MSEIKDKILYSKDELGYTDVPEIQINAGEFILKHISEVVKSSGDFEWMTNCSFEITVKTSECGQKSKMASKLEPECRAIGAALYEAGLRRNDIVQFAIPNSTEYHLLTFSAMLCGAAVSLSDPGLSSSVMAQQLKDTEAKIIICYEGSRKATYQALKSLDLLGKVKVIVLEKACPSPGEDQPVTEEGFCFFKGTNNAMQRYQSQLD